MKITISLVVIIFSNILIFSQPSFPGAGTEDEPYEIWTNEHFKELSDSIVNSNYPNYSEWNFDKSFKLMQDIDNIKCIRNGYFRANFDGNGKIISMALETDHDNPYFACVASFYGTYSHKYLKKLTLNGYVNDDNISAFGGTTFYGLITHCVNNVPIIGTGKYPTYTYAAGIVYTNFGTISHCINNGSVTGVDMVAGISVRSHQGGGKIFNCINTGKITASTTEIKEWWNSSGAAGICVEAPGADLLENCNWINLGDVEGASNVSGIASKFYGGGMFTRIISNCINVGYIKGKKNVGGIVGVTIDDPTITNCVNTGIIEGEEDVGNIVGGER